MSSLSSSFTSVKENKNNNSQESPQILLLTLQYPDGTNHQLEKSLSSSELPQQSQIFLEQVGNLLSLPKSQFLTQDAEKTNEKCETLDALLVVKQQNTEESRSKYQDVTLNITNKDSSSDQQFSPPPSLENLPDEINLPQNATFRNSPIMFETESLNDFDCSEKVVGDINENGILHSDDSVRVSMSDTTVEASSECCKTITQAAQRNSLSPILSDGDISEEANVSDVGCGSRDIDDTDSTHIMHDINLPNSLCSVGWCTDSEGEGESDGKECMDKVSLHCSKKGFVDLEDVENVEYDDSGVIHVISDKECVCRAKASLPSSHLCFRQIGSDENTIGVFACRAIPRRSLFGPIVGIWSKSSEATFQTTDCRNIVFSMKDKDGSLITLDLSNENLSNWMRYVRIAECYSEQNLLVTEQSSNAKGLYFTTSKSISVGDELKVWYSTGYAATRFLPLLSSNEDSKWSCPLCCYKCLSTPSIWEHMENHRHAKDSLIKKDTQKKTFCILSPERDLESSQIKRSVSKQVNSDSSCASSVADEFSSKSSGWWCSRCSLCFNTATMLNFHMLAHAADNLESTNMMDQCIHPHHRYVSSHGKPNNATSLALTTIHQANEICGDCGQEEPILGQENKPLNCDICHRYFSNSASLACHIKSHSIDKKYECPICGKNFRKILELKSHIHSHSKDGIFTCSFCPKQFVSYKNIRKHIRAYHSEKTHNCDECDKKFSTADKLNMHRLTHSTECQFLCANCGKQFKRKDKLSEHMRRMHFNCNEEEKSKSSKGSNIFKGLSIDEISRPLSRKITEDYMRFVYKCKICVISFKRRGMLVNHMASRHPEITLDSIPELNLPILKATRDYYCQYCDKIYKSSSKRKLHILKYHPGAKVPPSKRQLDLLPTKKSDSSNKNTESNLVAMKNGSVLDKTTFSQTVGSITTTPHGCRWCHKQFASRAKLFQHQRKNHASHLSKLEEKLFESTDEEDSEKKEAGLEFVAGVTCNDKVLLAASADSSFIAVPSVVTEYEVDGSGSSGNLGVDNDGHFIPEGEFIIDASTLRKVLKGEGNHQITEPNYKNSSLTSANLPISASSGLAASDVVSLEALLSQSRPDQYFKVTQTCGGLTLAQPLEMWDLVTPLEVVSSSK